MYRPISLYLEIRCMDHAYEKAHLKVSRGIRLWLRQRARILFDPLCLGNRHSLRYFLAVSPSHNKNYRPYWKVHSSCKMLRKGSQSIDPGIGRNMWYQPLKIMSIKRMGSLYHILSQQAMSMEQKLQAR